MDFIAHEVPLDSRFLKDRLNLVSKSSIRCRRRPSRYAHSSFVNRSVKEGGQFVVSGPGSACNVRGQYKRRTVSDTGFVSPGRHETEKPLCQKKSAVLIQTWERRSQTENGRVELCNGRVSSQKDCQRTLNGNSYSDGYRTQVNPTVKMPDRVNLSGPGKKTPPTAPQYSCCNGPVKVQGFLPGKPAKLETPRPLSRPRSLHNLSNGSSNDEPEWVSLSRKLCAKFIQSHLDLQDVDSSVDRHVRQNGFSPPPSPEKHLQQNQKKHNDIAKRNVKTIDDNSPAGVPQWVNLSRKLCTKFIEEHIECEPRDAESQPIPLAKNGLTLETTSEVRIIEKIGKKTEEKAKEKKEELPEWVTLSKRLRAKFIEGHKDDPDTISLDNQLNASDLEEYMETKHRKETLKYDRKTIKNGDSQKLSNGTEEKSNQKNGNGYPDIRQNIQKTYCYWSDIAEKERSQRHFVETGGTNDQQFYYNSTPKTRQLFMDNDVNYELDFESFETEDMVIPKESSDEDKEEKLHRSETQQQALQAGKAKSKSMGDLSTFGQSVEDSETDGFWNEAHESAEITPSGNSVHQQTLKLPAEVNQRNPERYDDHPTPERPAPNDEPPGTSVAYKGTSKENSSDGYREGNNAIRATADKFPHDDETTFRVRVNGFYLHGPGSGGDSHEDRSGTSSGVLPSSPRSEAKLYSDSATYTGKAGEETGKMAAEDNGRTSKFSIVLRSVNGFKSSLKDAASETDDIPNSFVSGESQRFKDAASGSDGYEEPHLEKYDRAVSPRRLAEVCVGTDSLEYDCREDGNLEGSHVSACAGGERDSPLYESMRTGDAEAEPMSFMSMDSLACVSVQVTTEQFTETNRLKNGYANDTEFQERAHSPPRSVAQSVSSTAATVTNGTVIHQLASEDYRRNFDQVYQSKCIVGNVKQKTVSNGTKEFTVHRVHEDIDCEESISLQKSVSIDSRASSAGGEDDARSEREGRKGRRASPEAGSDSGIPDKHGRRNDCPNHADVACDHSQTKSKKQSSRVTAYCSAASAMTTVGTREHLHYVELEESNSNSRKTVQAVSKEDKKKSARHLEELSSYQPINSPFEFETFEIPSLCSPENKYLLQQHESLMKSGEDPRHLKRYESSDSETATSSPFDVRTLVSPTSCASDSEVSSWTLTQNTSLAGTQSPVTETDISDCSMSVKCDCTPSCSEENTMQTRGLSAQQRRQKDGQNSRDPRSRYSEVFVDCETSRSWKKSKSLDQLEERGSGTGSSNFCVNLHEEKQDIQNSASNDKTEAMPESLRHLFNTPSNPIYTPAAKTSMLLSRTAEPPPCHYHSSAPLSSSSFKASSPTKSKKSERSSSLKLKDIAQGIILTFRKFHSHSKSSSLASSVDVSHLAETNGIQKDCAELHKKRISREMRNATVTDYSHVTRGMLSAGYFGHRSTSESNLYMPSSSQLTSWKDSSKTPQKVTDAEGRRPSFNSGKIPEAKRRKPPKKTPEMKEKKTKNHHGGKGKSKHATEEMNTSSISRKVQQMADGTLCLVTTVSGDSAVPGIYSDSQDTSSEVSGHVTSKQPGESSC